MAATEKTYQAALACPNCGSYRRKHMEGRVFPECDNCGQRFDPCEKAAAEERLSQTDVEEIKREVRARLADEPTEAQEVTSVDPKPFNLALDPVELLTTYAALKAYVRGLLAQDTDAIETIKPAVEVMAALKPGAVEASKLFQLQGGAQ